MKYLLSVYRPHDYDHAASLDDVARRAIDAVNEEMKVAGVRVFVGGLRPPDSARTLSPQSNGDIGASDGPYAETTGYVDGFWVLECANLDDAMAWGRKAALACRATVEVRAFH